MSDPSLDAGAKRFSGFAGLYDEVRPSPPAELGGVLASYCGGRPSLVVDLGCGTGLSSRWAAQWAHRVIGIEPSDDMRATAEAAAEAAGARDVAFQPGWSHDTALPDGCADVVLAVQALHWMEPAPTFAEVGRLLRAGGVFAAIDCDWPPVVGDAVAEEAWDTCRRTIRVFETRLAAGVSDDELAAPVAEGDVESAGYSGRDAHRRRSLPEGVRSWSKDEHLGRMTSSGVFGWCREVAMAATDSGNAERFVGMLRSQGDYQTLRRHGLGDDLLGVDRFAEVVDARLGDRPRPWNFVYRARLGFRG